MIRFLPGRFLFVVAFFVASFVAILAASAVPQEAAAGLARIR